MLGRNVKSCAKKEIMHLKHTLRCFTRKDQTLKVIMEMVSCYCQGSLNHMSHTEALNDMFLYYNKAKSVVYLEPTKNTSSCCVNTN